MNWRVALLALALFGCKPDGQPKAVGVIAGDGYYIEDISHRMDPIITVKTYPDRKALLAAFPGKIPADLQAYSTYNESGTRCTINIVDPKEQYRPQWLGHELVHCLYGKWHPSQGQSGRLVSVRSSSKAQVR